MAAESESPITLLFILLITISHAQVNLGGVSSLRKTPNCATNRTGKVIVHLFSWRWTDIAAECENFLGPKGFCGVQVSPPNEHRIVTTPKRPWWERYQPVSYKLDSASGTRDEFIDMVNKCNAAGVKVYVDAVINHMVAGDAGTGVGTAGSAYDTQLKTFPGVPYGPRAFGNKCKSINGTIDYTDESNIRNCPLLGLMDLNTGSNDVRKRIATYFDDMLTIGIDGYRIDAAKHIWPQDLEAIASMTRSTKSGETPFIYQEVIDTGNQAIKADDYQHVGRVTEFKYGASLADIFTGRKTLEHLKTFISSENMLASGNAVAFVDNHDNQRGHGSGGHVLTYKKPREYKMAVIFMLSWPYGVPRVMSSYDFTEDWTGPPSNGPGNNGLCENGWICEHRWRQITNMVNWRNVAGESAVENWWSNGNNQIAYSRGSSAFIAFNKNDGYMNEDFRTGLPIGQYCDVISGTIVNSTCTGRKIIVNTDSIANIQIDGASATPVVAFHLRSRISSSVPTSTPVTEPTTSQHSTPTTKPTTEPTTSQSSTPTTTPTTEPTTSQSSTPTTTPTTEPTTSQSSTPPTTPTNEPTTSQPSTPPTTPTTKPTTTVPSSTLSPNMRRTMVFIYKETKNGEDVFLRGGYSSKATSIPIIYPPYTFSLESMIYHFWSRGDTMLDWNGAEPRQRDFARRKPEGSPMLWTDQDPNHKSHHKENNYGKHFWMWDVFMDCTKVHNGYFEVKGFFQGKHENDIHQGGCYGDSMTFNKPSRNHIARCGYKNIFKWNDNYCLREPI